MSYLRKFLSVLRKLILIGWALAVVWIYIGNLVNFHQHRIWGKQLIPVAAYSTRAKEKDGLFTVKSDTDARLALPGLHFDFSTPELQVSQLPYFEFISGYIFLPDSPVLLQGFNALTFRGPPTA
jgi:hypothetical protein